MTEDGGSEGSDRGERALAVPKKGALAADPLPEHDAFRKRRAEEARMADACGAALTTRRQGSVPSTNTTSYVQTPGPTGPRPTPAPAPTHTLDGSHRATSTRCSTSWTASRTRCWPIRTASSSKLKCVSLAVRWAHARLMSPWLILPSITHVRIVQSRAFFYRWWRQQTDTRKAQVRQLVANRQLVFVNAGAS